LHDPHDGCGSSRRQLLPATAPPGDVGGDAGAVFFLVPSSSRLLAGESILLTLHPFLSLQARVLEAHAQI
jgi:hypothetical protein